MADRDYVREALGGQRNDVLGDGLGDRRHEDGELPDKPQSTPPTRPPLRFKPIDLQDLFALDIKPREMVLDPIIPEKGLVMTYAARGTGKTHVADSIAYAVAIGGKFLRWQAPKRRRVLLIDGEMPGAALRDRLQTIVAGADVQPEARMFQSWPAILSKGESAIWHPQRCKLRSILALKASSS